MVYLTTAFLGALYATMSAIVLSFSAASTWYVLRRGNPFCLN